MRVWNKNFIILWQGQMISDLGNIIFNLTLGFWVLNEFPRNLLLFGVIMALVAIPRILLGSYGGSFADSHDRKTILITTDLIRGVLFIFAGLGIMYSFLPIWVSVAIGIISGICSAFITPAIASSVPDLVKTENLARANSARSFAIALTQLIGNPVGVTLFVALGAPVVFVLTGFGFLYAAITQYFLTIPKHTHTVEKKNLINEITVGMRFTLAQKGLRTLVFTGMSINFFSFMGLFLLMPLFKENPDFGEKAYGVVMVALMIGVLVSSISLSIFKVKSKYRAAVTSTALIVMVGGMIIASISNSFVIILIFAFFVGAANAIVNVMIQLVAQITVDSENRGKVFGVMGTVIDGLSPIAMLLGVLIGSVVGSRQTIVAAFIMAGICVFPSMFNKSFRKFVNSEPIHSEEVN
ncbi:MAG: MFS transporter [Bacillota bacterium]